MAVSSTRTIPSGMEYAQHENTYAGFLHLLRWFIIHLILDVVALYFLLIRTAPGAGITLLLLAIVALGYGIVSTPAARRKAKMHSPAP